MLAPVFLSNGAAAQEEKSSFNAGEVIMEHLGDEHSWHILTWKQTEIAIPLPVILINDGKLVLCPQNSIMDTVLTTASK